MPSQELTDPQKHFLKTFLGSKSPDTTDVSDTSDTRDEDPEIAKLRAAWDTASAQMAPRVDALTKGAVPNAERIEKAWQAVQATAASEDYAKALAAAQRVGAAIDQMPKPAQAEDAQGVGGVSLVKLGIARNAWPGLQSAAHADLDTLKASLRSAYAPYPDQSAKVEAAVGRLDQVISTLDDTLKDQLDDVYNAQTEEARIATIGVVKRTVARFKTYVESDPVAVAIDDNSFAPNIAPIAPIRKNLDAMTAALGG